MSVVKVPKNVKRAAKRFADLAFMEAHWAEFVTQVFPAIDALREFDLRPVASEDGKYTRCRALKGLLGVVMSEVMVLEGHDAHTKHRRPKHVQARAILGRYVAEVLEDDSVGDIASWPDEKDVEKDVVVNWFVKATCELMQDLHVVLSDRTPAKKRASTFAKAMAA